MKILHTADWHIGQFKGPVVDGVNLRSQDIGHVIYAAADGGANTQMTGIYFEGTDSGVSLAALDGHVVAVDSVKAEGAKDMKLIVPKATAKKLISMGVIDDVTLTYTKNSAVFKSDEYTIYTRLITGNYFPYQKMIVSGLLSTVDSNLCAVSSLTTDIAGGKDIYDWTDNDVWLFLLRNHVDIPEIYLFLWQSGSSKRQMRVSQFFSVDTARSLVKMNEYYPDLMERIIRREPNAYLAALYWDSEMFGRSSRKRKEAEEGQEQRDYRQELIHLFNHMDVFFDTPHKRHVAERYRNFFMAVSAIATSADCKHIYEGLISGDPKMRAFRALYQRVYGRYINDAKKGEHHGQ